MHVPKHDQPIIHGGVGVDLNSSIIKVTSISFYNLFSKVLEACLFSNLPGTDPVFSPGIRALTHTPVLTVNGLHINTICIILEVRGWGGGGVKELSHLLLLPFYWTQSHFIF